MNIEQIAVGIKDAHGLDMSDEAAITLLRHALSKLAEQAGNPAAWWAPKAEQFAIMDKPGTRPFAKAFEPLYTETQLIAAQQKAAEACAKVCQNSKCAWIADVMIAIRNGDWRKCL